jgi:hypothetical protein
VNNRPGRARGSGDDVGKKLVLQRRDLVFEGKLALLQPLDVQLIGRAQFFLRHDLGIEIAVLGPKPRQLLTELALVRSLHALGNAREAACTFVMQYRQLCV